MDLNPVYHNRVGIFIRFLLQFFISKNTNLSKCTSEAQKFIKNKTKQETKSGFIFIGVMSTKNYIQNRGKAIIETWAQTNNKNVHSYLH